MAVNEIWAIGRLGLEKRCLKTLNFESYLKHGVDKLGLYWHACR